ncbi:MAG TPA: hypothetical protein VGC65_05375 [Bacteroidia bacterium]|jgi:hypothetical protein
MKHSLLVAFLIIIQPVFSQDNIIKKNGDEIKAKVVEVGTTEIKYKKFEKQSGPTYAISKSEVFMIKYEDGTKDVLNPIEEKKAEPAKTETTKEPAKKENKAESTNKEPENSKPTPSKTKYNYIEKVREVQSEDPGFRFYAGNGWFLGPGLANPLVGIDLRFPRKNVFLRGISIGLRANFKNIEGRDNDHNDNTDIGNTIFAGGVTVNYYAPLPIKIVQPYIIAHVGVAYIENQNSIIIHDPNSNVTNAQGVPVTQVGAGYTGYAAPFGGFGVGCNFMIARNFGFFVEAGYFRTSVFNTGVVFKLFKNY